jgi:hypothetical protein
MDQQRFDTMTRALATRVDRRQGLRVLLGVVGLVGAGAAVADAGAARQVCRRLDASCSRGAQCCTGICGLGPGVARRRRNRCVCAEGLIACNGACLDGAIDPDNCGSCGNTCDGSNEVCFSGACCTPNCDDKCAGDDGCGGVCNQPCASDSVCCETLGVCNPLDCSKVTTMYCFALAGGCVFEWTDDYFPGLPIYDTCSADADCLDNDRWEGPQSARPNIGCIVEATYEGASRTYIYGGQCMTY